MDYQKRGKQAHIALIFKWGGGVGVSFRITTLTGLKSCIVLSNYLNYLNLAILIEENSTHTQIPKKKMPKWHYELYSKWFIDNSINFTPATLIFGWILVFAEGLQLLFFSFCCYWFRLSLWIFCVSTLSLGDLTYRTEKFYWIYTSHLSILCTILSYPFSLWPIVIMPCMIK